MTNDYKEEEEELEYYEKLQRGKPRTQYSKAIGPRKPEGTIQYDEPIGPKRPTKLQRIKQKLRDSEPTIRKAASLTTAIGRGVSEFARTHPPSFGFGRQAGLNYGIGLMRMNFRSPFTAEPRREPRRKKGRKKKESEETDWWNFGF